MSNSANKKITTYEMNDELKRANAIIDGNVILQRRGKWIELDKLPDDEYYNLVRTCRLYILLGDNTQTSFANDIDVNVSTLSDYLRHKAEPKANIVAKIAKNKNVSADYILGLSNIKALDVSQRGAAEYVGLSDDACEELHLKSNELDGFYSKVLSYLIEKGYIDRIVNKIIESLISIEETEFLYSGIGTEEADKATNRSLDTFRYDYSIESEKIYSEVISDLRKDYWNQIMKIVKNRFGEILESADETIKYMQQIQDAYRDYDAYMTYKLIEQKEKRKKKSSPSNEG